MFCNVANRTEFEFVGVIHPGVTIPTGRIANGRESNSGEQVLFHIPCEAWGSTSMFYCLNSVCNSKTCPNGSIMHVHDRIHKIAVWQFFSLNNVSKVQK